MNREQFFRVVSELDEDRLRKALWNLYWRGTANVRERIDVELRSDGRGRPPRPAKEPADPEMVLFEVDDFVSLARSGAYMGGDRRVSPRERSRWRFTFKRLADGSPGRAARRGCRARSVRAGATDRPRVRSPRLRLLPLRRSVGSGGLRRVRCGGGVVGVDVGTPRVPGVRRNRCAAVDSVGVQVRLDPLRRGPGRGEGDLARRRAGAHAARSGHVGRLRRAVRAGAGRLCDRGASTRRYDIPRPGPSRSVPARWRNGTASCWKTSRTPRAACSTGSSPTPPWAVRSRRSSPHGSRTDAETPTSPATWWRDVCESCPATRTSATSLQRSARRPRREHRLLGYRRPSAARSRSASMPPRLASPAGNVSRSLIRSARRVGSSAACRGVWPSSAGMGSSSHLVS